MYSKIIKGKKVKTIKYSKPYSSSQLSAMMELTDIFERKIKKLRNEKQP